MVRPQTTYLPQIDGLRAYAVGIVLFSHFWFSSVLAGAGVRLFFAISGFLITGILLSARDNGGSFKAAVGRFYARRTLRIFPAYYALLFATWLFGDSEVRETIWWHLTYTSNFLAMVRGKWGYMVGHLWSLSVEEQFYLVWPLLILLLPARALLPMVVSLIVGGLATRLAFCLAGSDPIAIAAFTPMQFDVIGAGALLAILRHRRVAVQPSRAAHLAALMGLLVAVAVAVLWPDDSSASYEALFATASAAPIVWLLLQASADRPGAARILLANPVVLYLGKISYGIYLYHLLAHAAMNKLLDAIGLPHPPFGPLLFLVDAPTTVLVAALSWRFFEAPILELKRFFRDPPRPARLAHAPAGSTSGAG